MKEVVRGLTAPLSARKFRMGSRGLKPCVAACQAGGLFPLPPKQVACQPRWLANSEV
jgi:large subunit ribosomal protein L33